MLFVFGMFTVYGLVTGRSWLPLDADAQTWCFLLLSGFFGFFLGDLCIFKAFLMISVRLAMLITCFTPIISQLVAYIFFRETPTWWQFAGILVTLAGILWVVLESPNAADSAPQPHYWRGVLLAFLSTFFFGLSYVLIDFGDKTYDPTKQAVIRIIGSFLGFLPFLTLARRWPSIGWALKQRVPMIVVALGALVGPGVGAVLMVYAKQHGSTGTVVAIICTQPVMILPFSTVLFKEKVSLRAWLGAVISVAGVAAMLWKT
jgi:drug/metabolite transporter (DMT)-like permease